jgi:iron complex transport system ATP-binding protein
MCLRVANLNYQYSAKFSLKNINLCLENSLTAVLGPNGAGKSTLIKCIANILKYKGEIYYLEQKINQEFYADNVSYLPQTTRNEATITVFEAVLLGFINTLSIRVTAKQIKEVNEMLDSFELQALAQRRISELSGGQLQMIMLVQAIIKKPKILLLDEPLNNLDIYKQFSLMNTILKLSREREMITIIVMHDINLAARYADNIVIMDNGLLYSHGDPRKVITEKMLKDIYRIESNIHLNTAGYPVIEFLDAAANF